jgi:hypothetical protein
LGLSERLKKTGLLNIWQVVFMVNTTAKKSGKKAAYGGRGRKTWIEKVKREQADIRLGTEVADLGRLEERRGFLLNKKQTTGLTEGEAKELLMHEKLNPLRKKRLYHKLSQG